jgi:molecular chaperone GrpE
MTGKEQKEEMKQDATGKKKQTARHVDKPKHEADHHEKQKAAEALKASEEKYKELHDKYLRLSAEFDNYRKRTLKEKAELVKTASEEVIRNIIPFVDDIERGLNAVNATQNLEALKQGMNLIYGRLKDFLQLNGVKEIEALNQEFNTDVHEAVTKIPAAEEGMKGKVVEVIEKGYFLHDKVIRYPKVVIGE